ncbi:MAG: hypothetical protein PVF35_07965, partial [Gammaproteobacteria bacterium]
MGLSATAIHIQESCVVQLELIAYTDVEAILFIVGVNSTMILLLDIELDHHILVRPVIDPDIRLRFLGIADTT